MARLPGLITTPIVELVRDLPAGATPAGRHCRNGRCRNCLTETWQVKHGFTLAGALWKGHVCACRACQCSECGKLIDPVGECCR